MGQSKSTRKIAGNKTDAKVVARVEVKEETKEEAKVEAEADNKADVEAVTKEDYVSIDPLPDIPCGIKHLMWSYLPHAHYDALIRAKMALRFNRGAVVLYASHIKRGFPISALRIPPYNGKCGSPLPNDEISFCFRNPDVAISSIMHQWEREHLRKITVVLVIFDRTTMVTDVPLVQEILVGIKYMLADVTNLVAATDTVSSFFEVGTESKLGASIEQRCESNVASMSGNLSRIAQIDTSSDDKFCMTALTAFTETKGDSLSSLVMSLHDVSTWAWYQSIFLPNVSTFDRRLRLLVALDKNGFWADPEKLASLQYLSFLYVNPGFMPSKDVPPILDFSKCLRIIAIDITILSPVESIILPYRVDELEVMSVKCTEYKGIPHGLGADSYPHLQRLNLPVGGPSFSALRSDRFPALNQLTIPIYFKDTVFDLSGISRPDFKLSLTNFLGEIKAPATPLDYLETIVRTDAETLRGDLACVKMLSSSNVHIRFDTASKDRLAQKYLHDLSSLAIPENYKELQLSNGIDWSAKTVPIFFQTESLQHLVLDRICQELDGKRFPALESVSFISCPCPKMKGNFNALRSLKVHSAYEMVPLVFTAPLLKEVTFDDVHWHGEEFFGRKKYPRLRFVTIVVAKCMLNCGLIVKPKFIYPTLVAGGELDREHPVVLKLHHSISPECLDLIKKEVPDWIISATCPSRDLRAYNDDNMLDD